MSANRGADNTSAFLMQNTKDRVNGQTLKKRMEPLCCGNETVIMFLDYKLAAWRGKNHRSFFKIFINVSRFFFFFLLPVGVLVKKNVKFHVNSLLII